MHEEKNQLTPDALQQEIFNVLKKYFDWFLPDNILWLSISFTDGEIIIKKKNVITFMEYVSFYGLFSVVDFISHEDFSIVKNSDKKSNCS